MTKINYAFFDNFGVFLPCSDIYSLNVSARGLVHIISVSIGSSELKAHLNRIIRVARENNLSKL